MPNEQWETRLVRVRVRAPGGGSGNPEADSVEVQTPGCGWLMSRAELDRATVTPPDMKEVEGLVEKLAVVLTNPPKPRHTVGELQAWHKAEDDARAALLSAISALAAPRIADPKRVAELLAVTDRKLYPAYLEPEKLTPVERILFYAIEYAHAAQQCIDHGLNPEALAAGRLELLQETIGEALAQPRVSRERLGEMLSVFAGHAITEHLAAIDDKWTHELYAATEKARKDVLDAVCGPKPS